MAEENINGLKGTIKNQQKALLNRDLLIRNYKRKLKQLRDGIDYLLNHPYSDDTGNCGRRHKRDVPRNQLIKDSKKNEED